MMALGDGKKLVKPMVDWELSCSDVELGYGFRSHDGVQEFAALGIQSHDADDKETVCLSAVDC